MDTFDYTNFMLKSDTTEYVIHKRVKDIFLIILLV